MMCSFSAFKWYLLTQKKEQQGPAVYRCVFVFLISHVNHDWLVWFCTIKRCAGADPIRPARTSIGSAHQWNIITSTLLSEMLHLQHTHCTRFVWKCFVFMSPVWLFFVVVCFVFFNGKDLLKLNYLTAAYVLFSATALQLECLLKHDSHAYQISTMQHAFTCWQ